MKERRVIQAAGAVLFAALAVASTTFVVDAAHFAVVTELGQVKRVYKEDARGLHWKLPSPIQSALLIDSRLQVQDLAETEYLTQDKTNVTVQTYCLWKVADPVKFVQTVFDAAGATHRLSDVVSSEMGSAFGEVPFTRLVSAPPEMRLSEVEEKIAAAVREAARRDYGIEVVDVRVKRLSFPEQNKASVFDRMRAERGRIAKKLRSEGEEEALKVRAQADQEKTRLLAEAKRDADRTRGEGEAEAAKIYAEAVGKDPEFYQFVRTLEAYGKFLDEATTLILPADSELLRLLDKGAGGGSGSGSGKGGP